MSNFFYNIIISDFKSICSVGKEEILRNNGCYETELCACAACRCWYKFIVLALSLILRNCWRRIIHRFDQHTIGFTLNQLMQTRCQRMEVCSPNIYNIYTLCISDKNDFNWNECNISFSRIGMRQASTSVNEGLQNVLDLYA